MSINGQAFVGTLDKTSVVTGKSENRNSAGIILCPVRVYKRSYHQGIILLSGYYSNGISTLVFNTILGRVPSLVITSVYVFLVRKVISVTTPVFFITLKSLNFIVFHPLIVGNYAFRTNARPRLTI